MDETVIEAQRLQVLRRLAVMDTAHEPAFDAVAEVARRVFAAPTALITFIDSDRIWFKAAAGFDACESPREESFCQHAIATPDRVMIVPDARRDPRLRDMAAVTGAPFVRFYAGAPIVLDGAAVGTLCVFGPEPRDDFGAEEAALLASLTAPVVEALRLRLELGERRALSHAVELQGRTLAMAEQLAGVGHWTLDDAGVISWSDEVYRIHGLDPARFNPALDDAIAAYHPEDQGRVAALVDRAMATGEGFAFQARLTRASDGSVRTVLCRGERRAAEDDRPATLFGAFQDVTESEALLETTRRSEARYRLLAENANDMIALTSPVDGRVLFVSPGCRRVLGYAPQELVGRSTLELTHPDDRDETVRLFTAMLANGPTDTTTPYRFRGRHRDGGWRWLEGQPRVVFDASGVALHFQDVVRDITARKQAEDAAQEASRLAEEARALAAGNELRYRVLADNATDLILRLGLDGRILYASPSGQTLLGYTPEETAGAHLLDFVHPDDSARAADMTRRTLAGEPVDPAVDRMFRARRRDGSYIWIESAPSMVRDAQGRPVEVVSVLRDVSARRALQAELIQARDAAQAAVRAKSDFLANMSHELRTPLTGILGYAEVLTHEPAMPGALRVYAERIGEAGRGLLALVNDVLDLSKIESAGVELEPEPVRLADLAAAALDLVRPQAEAKGLRLTLDADVDAPRVEVDPDRLRQVLLNLLSNAVKFTERGHVGLSVRATASGSRRADVTVQVTDTGVGVAPERLEQVFGRFEQADASITRRYGGTGLGLAISRALVEAMGGTISACSELGRGSTFTVVLTAPVAASPQARVDAAPEARTRGLEGLRVLAAEDVAMNRELIGLFLEPCGIGLTLAQNGVEAVAAAEAQAFDVVLMDMQMPVMGGLEAVRRIRGGGGPNARTPVLALTANVLAPEIARCREAGMDGHVAKPFTPQSLKTALLAAIADRSEAPRAMSRA